MSLMNWTDKWNSTITNSLWRPQRNQEDLCVLPHHNHVVYSKRWKGQRQPRARSIDITVDPSSVDPHDRTVSTRVPWCAAQQTTSIPFRYHALTPEHTSTNAREPRHAPTRAANLSSTITITRNQIPRCCRPGRYQRKTRASLALDTCDSGASLGHAG